MKIAVLGAGSMGSVFGGRLSAAGHEVWLVHRREAPVHAIREGGLIIEKPGGRARVVHPRATTDLGEVGPADLVIVFVKATDTAAAAAGAGPLVGPDTVVLSLQNGLGNLEALGAAFGPERVMAGITYAGARTLGPGHVVHHIEARTVIGATEPALAGRVREVAAALEGAGLPTSVDDDVLRLIWSKAVVNISVNAVTALTGLRFSEIPDAPEAMEMVLNALDECLAVAKALGIAIEFADDPHRFLREHLRRIGPNKSSMLQDFERGRKTEIEALNGALVARAWRLDIDVPYNEMLTTLVQGIERQLGVVPAGGAPEGSAVDPLI
ncbi:MAG TPA: 2-dehydropantoate 2-reductase [Geminicoccaceae bacterium]|nr:2-dehydropantoate 2-reductase [Geminicoccaceae bacterium]